MTAKKSTAKKTPAKKADPAPPLPASRTIADDATVEALRANPSRNLSVPGITPR